MPAELPPYRRADLAVDQRVADLLGRMTLEEKIALSLGPSYSASLTPSVGTTGIRSASTK